MVKRPKAQPSDSRLSTSAWKNCSCSAAQQCINAAAKTQIALLQLCKIT